MLPYSDIINRVKKSTVKSTKQKRTEAGVAKPVPWMDNPRLESRHRQEISLFSKTPRLAPQRSYPSYQTGTGGSYTVGRAAAAYG
jgi:hypothetical protein